MDEQLAISVTGRLSLVIFQGPLQFWNSVLYSLSLTESYSCKKEVRAITLNYLFLEHKKRVKFSQQSLLHSNPACKTYIL